MTIDMVAMVINMLYLWFDVVLGDTVIIEPLDIKLTVKMTNVAYNGVLWQLKEHFSMYDVSAACSCDYDTCLGESFLDC